MCSRKLTLEFALFMPNVEIKLLVLKIRNNGCFVRVDGIITDEVKTDIKIIQKRL